MKAPERPYQALKYGIYEQLSLPLKEGKAMAMEDISRHQMNWAVPTVARKE